MSQPANAHRDRVAAAATGMHLLLASARPPAAAGSGCARS